MKQLYHLSCFLLALLLPASALAHDFEVDGIYYNIINDNEVAVTYKGTSVGQFEEYTDDVTIPETTTFNDTIYLVTSISEKAFSNCKGLTSIAVPNSVTSIGYYAFSYTGVSTVNFNAINCTNMGLGSYYSPPFSYCDNLTTLNIGNSVQIIPDAAFGNCSNLTGELVLPETVT